MENNRKNMDNSSIPASPKRKINPTEKLKSRLFEKGLGHSSMSSFKSPLSTDYSNRMLLVNLTSANSTKYSPKVIRKQVAGLPFQKDQGIDKKKFNSNQLEKRLKTASYDKFHTKQMEFLEQIAFEEKKKTKFQTSSNFYNAQNKNQIDEVQEINTMFEDSHESQQIKRTKNLLEKLSGKSKFVIRNEKKSVCPEIIVKKQQMNQKVPLNNNELSPKNRNSPIKNKEPIKITLQSYISKALKDEENLQQFLYLVNTKQNIDGTEKIQEDPYELYVVQYDNNKENELTLNNKYYTVSKKGLCYYVNSKPVEFIQLDQWVNEKHNYQKIKNLNFFNRFRRWKTVKMWRKIVLKHRIQKCSKNLQEKLFFLNPIMRLCLFQIQEISLQLQKNLVILGSNNDDYSLENFKVIQQKNKKRISLVIQQFSKESRASVKKCFEENLRNLKGSMIEKEKEDQEEKTPNITTHINLKDSAFQALGFAPKMSYQKRSQLRKMAGKFIRFSYLVDMIHSAGLAICFKNQISSFISKLVESQSLQNLEIIMTREDSKTLNGSQAESNKIFNIKLLLAEKDPSPQTIVQIPFKTNDTDGLELFNPVYHIRLSDENEELNDQKTLREYCPTICNQWLSMEPRFQDIYEEIISQIKQSLNCLKYFERWSKHRDMEKYINILEEWDDVVSQSRQISQNQNLDPVSTITNFEGSLSEIKKILFQSLNLINNKIEQEFTEFLNIHWQEERIDLNLFKNPKLQSPAQTVEYFLKYITNSINNFDKKIPHRIRLGIFQINLSQIRVELMRQAEDTYNNFKQLLPVVVQQRTQFLDNWFEKYIKFFENPVQNIDQFIGKVKLIKEIERTFELKKQLCFNLTSINQIMEIYKFGQRKKKQFDTNKSNPLKAKDFLEKQIYEFEQNLQKQSQFYLNCVNKIQLPNIIKDISKMTASLKNQKYVTLDKNSQNHREIIRQIEQLARRYKDIQQRNLKFMQYQDILHQCRGIDKEALSLTKNKLHKNQHSDAQQIPIHCQELMMLKQSIESLLYMWQKYEKWSLLLRKYNTLTIKSILEQQEKIGEAIKQQKYFINNRLKKVLETNQVVKQLERIIQIFEKYFPIINGLNNNLSETHWEEIHQLVQKNRSNSVLIDLQKLDSLVFSDLVASCIGQFKDQFEQIFIKASNEIQLQSQYLQIEKKWKTALIKTRIQGTKYNVILDQAEHQSVLGLINEAMDTLTRIFSNPYSIRLQVGVLTYESLMGAMQTYNKWISVQKKLIMYDKICKSIDMKKISQGNLIESAEKQYKPIFKMHLVRNIQTSFNITKLCPPGNASIRQKLQQCEKILNCLQNSIKNMLNEQRRNYPLFYQLDDSELLRIVMQTTGQQNTNNLASIVEQLLTQKFMEGVIKNLKVEGQRITGIFTIDNENMLRSSASISLTSDIQTIIDQVIETVGDYCKRMIKSCRVKSSQNSLLSIVDIYNIQFLLTISKVDFSNYTTISIQNSQVNPESLKQYLKIMIKDTKNGIKKLKERKINNIYAYETLILQNLIHQKILEQLVRSSISCANDYSWIKFLRFYWEDNNTQQTPINVKKMLISLRYGKQFVGSKSRVLIENNSPALDEYDNLDMIMSIIRNSEAYCYLGNYERLANFMNCIAHHFYKIKCTKQMTTSFGNPLKMILKSRQGSDCCYFVQDSHLLSEQVISEILSSSSQNLSKSKLNIQKGEKERKINNLLTISSLDNVPFNYSPVFLHIQMNENTFFMINREQFRNVSLAVPNNEFLVCYLFLIQENISTHFFSKTDTLNNLDISNKNNTKLQKNARNDSTTNQSTGTQSNFVSPIETIKVLKKIFYFVKQLEVTQKKSKLGIEIFLEHAKNKIRKIIYKQPMTKTKIDIKIERKFEMLQEQSLDSFDLNVKLNLNEIVLEILMEYLRANIRKDSYEKVIQYLKIAYPDIQYEKNQEKQQKNESKVQVKIMLGYRNCLQNYQKNQDHQLETYEKIDEVILDQYSEKELYGFQNQQGLFYKLFYGFEGGFKKSLIDSKRKIIIKGMNERLITYLSAIVQENFAQQTFSNRPSSSQQPENSQRINSLQRKNSIIDLAKNFMNLKNQSIENERDQKRNMIVNAVLSKNPNLNASGVLKRKSIQVPQNLLIEIHSNSLSQLIDPKIITLFKIESVVNENRFGNYWRYLDERIKNWIQLSLNEYRFQKQNFYCLFKNCVQKFYSFVIKGLWKDIYKVYQINVSAQNVQSQLIDKKQPSGVTQSMINTIQEFLKFLETLIPQLFNLAADLPKSTETNIQFQKSTIYACIYSLCYIYKPYIDLNTDYIKLENLLQKLLSESWLGIPQRQRTSPDQFELKKEITDKIKTNFRKKRYTYFDFIFDGNKLVCLQQFCYRKYPDRVLERGQFYLTDQMAHLNLIAERTLKSGKFGLIVQGDRNSGKSTFSRIYRCLHFEETIHMVVRIANKNKKQIYEKICKVLSLKNLSTICPKINYSKSLIVIDDLHLPNDESSQRARNIRQISSWLSTIIRNKMVVTPESFKKYHLQNTNFIINLNPGTNQNSSSQNKHELNKTLENLQNCTIKYQLDDPFQIHQNGLKNIFTQLLKANVLDPEINQSILNGLISFTFDLYRQMDLKVSQAKLRNKSSLTSKVLYLQTIKKMIMFASHLRIKQNNSSANQICRFWAYLIKDNFQAYCSKFEFAIKDLQTLTKCTQNLLTSPNSSKSFIDFLKQPMPSILYSHLFIKQQVYGNGKQVQHVRDIQKLYNKINEDIEDYNKTDKVRRYGYSFQFISIDQLIVKIVKMSNILISGDYAVFARKGSEIGGLIRLVSYIQGFNYKQKSKQIKKGKIIDLVKDTILELTKVSLYLISIRIDDSNIEQFLEYYDADFEAEVVGSLQQGYLQNIQATGAFYFGINSNQSTFPTENPKNYQSVTLAKSNSKANNAQVSSSNFKNVTHSHQNSNMVGENLNRNSIHSLGQQSARVMKPNLRELNKIKRSIRLVFEFNSVKYLKQEKQQKHYISPSILSQLHIDFFQQYPQQSIIRFSEEILMLGIPNQNEDSKEIKQLIENSKCQIRLMTEVYELAREDLQLSLKEYEQCIRLYWSFLGTFPDEMRQKMNKYESIMDMNAKLNEIIKEYSQQRELKCEEKKVLTEKITKMKQTHDNSQEPSKIQATSENIQKIQLNLSCISTNLQQLTQSVSECEKIITFFKPSYQEFNRRYEMTKKLLDNKAKYLNQCLVIVACYFTYLSKLPFATRKMHLKNWYKKCLSLSHYPEADRLSSISQLFYLIREEDMVINQQNEQHYENMTIILESIKPVLIRDDKNLGRNWMKFFDTSFVTVSQSSPDFYQKLGQYLGNSNNILLQITNQQTIENSQTNFINSLIFMSENTPKIQINDQEYQVSKQSKVYIVVAPHIVIPQEILSEHLYVTYEQSQQSFLKILENEIMMTNAPDKYNEYLEYKKKQLFIMNQCLSLEFNLANMIWHQFYTTPNEQSDDEDSKSIIGNQQDDNEKQTNSNLKKSKQQLLAHIEVLNKKGVIDKLQQFAEKYNVRTKQLSEIRDKILVINLPSNYNQMSYKNKQQQKTLTQIKSSKEVNLRTKSSLQQVICIIKNIYSLLNLLQSKFDLRSLDMSVLTYYQTIKLALKNNLIIINLHENANNAPHAYNLGMLTLFILRQWGQRLNRCNYNMLALGIIVIIQNQINDIGRNKIDSSKKSPSIKEISKESSSDSNEYDTILRKFVEFIKIGHQNWTSNYLESVQSKKTKVLQILAENFQSKSYSLQTLEEVITQSILSYIDEQCSSQFVFCQNNIAKIISNFPINQTGVSSGILPRPTKINSNIIHMSEILSNDSSLKQNDKKKQDLSWILKNLIILTGEVQSNLYNEELACETNIHDSHTFYNWYYRRAIQKILESEMVSSVQIKHTDNIEGEIKKIINDKLNIFIPMIYSPSDSETSKQKSQTTAEMIINQIVSKYAPIILEPKQDMKSSKVNYGNTQYNSNANNSLARIEMNKSNMFLNQNLTNVPLQTKEPKISQDFKIYLYHNSIKKILHILEKALGISANKIGEKVFIRDISNHMCINHNIFSILRGKKQRKINIEEESHYHNQKSIQGQSKQKTKKNIGSISEQKEVKIKGDKKSNPVPSMRILQVEAPQTQTIPSHNETFGNQITQMKTNKHISQTGSQFVLINYLYEVTNHILMQIERIICKKTGKLDFNPLKRNVFENLKWFISSTYFYGIEKNMQILTLQNEYWTFYHHIILICQIFKNLIRNTKSLLVERDHLLKLLNKIINKMQSQSQSAPRNNLNVNLNITTGSQSKVKIMSNKNLNDQRGYQINELQIKCAIEILNKILQQDTSSIPALKNDITDFSWEKYKQLSQLMNFKLVWLDQFRNLMGLEEISLQSYQNLFDNLIKSQNSKIPMNMQKRIDRKSKNIQNNSDGKRKQSQSTNRKNIQQLKQKQLLSKQSQNEEQLGSSQENRQLNSLAIYWLRKNTKKVQIKINLLKNHYMTIIDKLAHHREEGKKMNSYKYMEKVLYKLNLINEAKIMPSNWLSYLECCNKKRSQQNLSVVNVLKKLMLDKNEMESQMGKLLKDRNYSIDLSNCSNPLQFIKAYLANEFEQRINRELFSSIPSGINYSNENEQASRAQNTKRQELVYYTISSSLGADELKKDQYIKLKSIYAIGWKLNNDGSYELTQQDKVSLLSNIYISKRAKPQQMGLCEIMLAESELQKTNGIKLYVHNKKNQKSPLRFAFVRTPEI